MSIFEGQPKCAIPHCTEGAQPEKKRCKKCENRYDYDGRAYIIYCEFWKYQPIERKRNGITQQDITLWVCDSVVQKAPITLQRFVGDHVAILDAYLEKTYCLMNIEPPQA